MLPRRARTCTWSSSVSVRVCAWGRSHVCGGAGDATVLGPFLRLSSNTDVRGGFTRNDSLTPERFSTRSRPGMFCLSFPGRVGSVSKPCRFLVSVASGTVSQRNLCQTHGTDPGNLPLSVRLRCYTRRIPDEAHRDRCALLAARIAFSCARAPSQREISSRV